MAVRPEEDEAIAVLADAHAGMDQHVIADQGRLDRAMRADITVPADLDPGTDHRRRPDHRARADFDVRADHGQGIDNDAIFEMRRRIDDRRRRNAVVAEPGLRTQRVAVPFPRDPDKGPERLRRAQHRHVGRHAPLKALADETCPRLGQSELIGVSRVVEERQVHRAGFVERRQTFDLKVAPGRIG